MGNQLITIIIPALNEESNIPLVYDRLCKILANEKFEVLFIDDGSTDTTATVIKKLAEKHSNIKGLFFTKNFGHQAALKAGFDHAAGDCAITLDCDLEHPPEYITHMIQLWRSGFEVVISTRNTSHELTFFKRFSSHFFYTIFNLCSEVKIKPGSADFRLLDQKVLSVCKEIKEPDLFWRGIIPSLGFKTTYLPYDQAKRTLGKSKYNFLRMFKLSIAGITSSSVRPLYLGFYLGILFAIPGFLFTSVQLALAVFSQSPVWNTKIAIGTVCFFAGLQLTVTGILSIYLGKLIKHLKNPPHYVLSGQTETTKTSDMKKAG